MIKKFSNKSAIVILLVVTLFGCAGSTKVQRKHHLLLADSSKAFVCFMRPKEGFIGVMGKPMGITLDGEELLDLTIGDYTFFDIKPGTYDMVVTNSTVEGPNNAEVKTSRNFILDFAQADSVYLLFALEKHDFWTIMNKKIEVGINNSIEKLAENIFTVRIGQHVTLKFYEAQLKQNHPGTGYTVRSVSRDTAIEAASKLNPVAGAQSSPLHK